MEIVVSTTGEHSLWRNCWPITNISSDSSSFECMNKIIEWISQCEMTHNQCTEADSTSSEHSIFPKRLLNLGTSDKENQARVIDVEEQSCPRYCALSYCWGPDPHLNLLTTQENLQERMNGIAIAQMPTLFQDVICICRRLACRYVWVSN